MDWHARARALGYPYTAPDADCVWSLDGHVPLEGTDVNAVAAALQAAGADPRAKRTPILAIGSNRAPEQLARKFYDFPKPAAVILARAWLKDFDVVYGASIAGYGSIGGATLTASPGTEIEVWATWLDDAQLARMHETEGLSSGAYGLFELQQINLAFVAGPEWTSALAYVQRCGALNIGGEPAALKEVPARGRRFQALNQRDVQALLRDRFAPGLSVDAFLQENLTSPAMRAARGEPLAANALPFDWPHRQDRTPASMWPPRPGR